MKTIFRTLACVAALSFFVACGPSVTGNPTEDAKTFVELVKAGKAEAAGEYTKELEKKYANDPRKLIEFKRAVEKGLGDDFGF